MDNITIIIDINNYFLYCFIFYKIVNEKEVKYTVIILYFSEEKNEEN